MRTDADRLAAKAARFFRKGSVRRREVVAFAAELQVFGPTVAIGGVLRDLHLVGATNFRSDVDFVVDPEDLGAFDRFADRHGAKLNRFGGFGMRRGAAYVDVWPLKRTWARVAGHRRVENLRDLLATTFFDWDAMVYDLSKGELTAKPGTMEAIASCLLDVNLAANPNPAGNAVRALRYGVRHGADLGPALREHVARQVRDRGWDALVDAEKASFTTRLLPYVDQAATWRRLNGDAPRTSIPVLVQQFDLPFAHSRAMQQLTAAPVKRDAVEMAPMGVNRRRVRYRPITGEMAFG